MVCESVDSLGKSYVKKQMYESSNKKVFYQLQRRVAMYNG